MAHARSTPLHSTPLHFTPLHSAPFHSTPLHPTPLHSAACRVINHIKKLPMDLALEHGASQQVLDEISAGEKAARDSEVGILAWLWG